MRQMVRRLLLNQMRLSRSKSCSEVRLRPWKKIKVSRERGQPFTTITLQVVRLLSPEYFTRFGPDPSRVSGCNEHGGQCSLPESISVDERESGANRSGPRVKAKRDMR